MATPQSNPDSPPVYRCMTKGVKGAPEEFARGLPWVTARRSILEVYDDRLECGDWIIPFAEVEAATLFETRQMFIPCYILKVRVAGNTFQFGLNGNRFWRGELPFPVTRDKGRLGYSTFSIVARLIVIGVIAYLYFR